MASSWTKRWACLGLIASSSLCSTLLASNTLPEGPVGVDVQALRAQSSSDMQFYNDLAVGFFRQGDHHQARKFLEQALASDPISKQTFSNLQALYEFLGALSYAQTQDDKTVSRPALTTIAEMRSGIILPATEVNAEPIPLAVDTPKASADQAFDDIMAMANQYFQRWSAGDADSFISYYCTSFARNDRSNWEDGRRARIYPERGIELDIHNLEARWIGPERLRLQYNQRFEARDYRDHTVKELIWQLENDRWCIESDEELRVVNRG